MDHQTRKGAVAIALLLCLAVLAGQKNAPSVEGKIPAGQMWMICVVPNLATMTEPQASIEKSVELDKLLTSKGNFKRFVDAETAPEGAEPYLSRAKRDDSDNKGRILIMDSSAKKFKDSIKDSQPMTDEKAAIALAKKWGGE